MMLCPIIVLKFRGRGHGWRERLGNHHVEAMEIDEMIEGGGIQGGKKPWNRAWGTPSPYYSIAPPLPRLTYCTWRRDHLILVLCSTSPRSGDPTTDSYHSGLRWAERMEWEGRTSILEVHYSTIAEAVSTPMAMLQCTINRKVRIRSQVFSFH